MVCPKSQKSRHDTCSTRILPVRLSWNSPAPPVAAPSEPWEPAADTTLPDGSWVLGDQKRWSKAEENPAPEPGNARHPTPTISEWPKKSTGLGYIWTNLQGWWQRPWSFLLLLVCPAIAAFTGQMMEAIFSKKQLQKVTPPGGQHVDEMEYQLPSVVYPKASHARSL